jgi:peptidoglycan hydrolase-like amidase
MCQAGAIGRARAGQSYDYILKKYYSGVEIKKAY